MIYVALQLILREPVTGVLQSRDERHTQKTTVVSVQPKRLAIARGGHRMVNAAGFLSERIESLQGSDCAETSPGPRSM